MKVLYFTVAVVACSLCIATTSAQTTVAGCGDNGCASVNGNCTLKTDNCTGTSWNKGCSGRTCTCCLPATSSECIAKPWCMALGGRCGASTCTGVLSQAGCHGGCSCCIPRVIANSGCKDKGQCNSNGGYCFTKNVHPCKGVEWDGGCGGPTCSCCILDKTLCVIKQKCVANGGTCVAPASCNRPNRNPKWCIGKNCTCCY